LAASEFGFVPLFTGELFIAAEGLLSRDSREVTGGTGWHARYPIAGGVDKRLA